MAANISPAVVNNQQPGYSLPMNGTISLAGMAAKPHKRNITAADREAAARLKARWLAIPKSERPTQAKLADAWEDGDANQSLISQYMGGRIALNYRALLFFARQLGFRPEEIRNDLPEQKAGYIENSSRSTVSVRETSASYVRIEQLDAEGEMGDGAVNEDYPDVVRAMDFTETYIRGLIGFKPPPGRLTLLTGRGNSMVPVIQPGDVVVVDTGCQTFDGDGIYLINTGNGQQIKALQDRGDAVYVVSANAELYPPFPVPSDTVIGGKVYLRNRIERLN